MKIERTWAMPSSETFSIPPIGELLARWLKGRPDSVDPFARDSKLARWRNDLDPETAAPIHMDAIEFCQSLEVNEVLADLILFDPPYSPRQIVEVYKRIGLATGMETTQNGRFYKEVRDALDSLLKPGGIAISFGWNSAGFGEGRGYRIEEILLVAHGGAHNDTICVVERKMQAKLDAIAYKPISVATGEGYLERGASER